MKYRNKYTKQVGEVFDETEPTPVVILEDGTRLLITRALLRNEWILIDESPAKILEAKFTREMRKWNATHDENEASKFGVIVYSQRNFGEIYSETQRSYRVSNANGKYQNKRSDSLIGSCLDGTDENLQLDYFDWFVDYCYFE